MTQPLNNLELSNVTQEDKYIILGVYRQCEDFLALGPEPKASLEMVLKDIEDSQDEEGIFQGIYSEGRLVGIISFIPYGFEGKPETAFMSLLMIAAPFRGKGIGTEIVRHTEKEILADSRITTILTAVQANNPAALRFWQKNGYRITGEPELRPDSTTVFHLRKDRQPITQVHRYT